MALSDREYRRSQVMVRVVDGEVTMAEAAELVCLSMRQVKRLAKRYRSGGAGALVHGNFGHRSNHARPASEKARAIELIRERKQHFGELVQRAFSWTAAFTTGSRAVAQVPMGA